MSTLWIEVHGAGPRPVSDVAGPSLRMARPSSLVEGFTLREHLDVLASMPLSRRHEADSTVEVLFVVPVHERSGPLTGGLERGEPAVGILWPVLRRPEQGL